MSACVACGFACFHADMPSAAHLTRWLTSSRKRGAAATVFCISSSRAAISRPSITLRMATSVSAAVLSRAISTFSPFAICRSTV